MAFPKSALITGVSGFLGASLAEHLIRQGYQVAGVIRAESSTWRVQHLQALELCKIEPGNAFTGLSELMKACRPDVVFHLAAAGVVGGNADTTRLFESNVEFSFDLVRAVACSPGTCLIHAGSCFEYGPSDESHLTEKSSIAPFSFYGATKAASVHLVQALAKEVGVHQITLRPFGVFGPGEDEQRLLPSLVKQLDAQIPVPLTSGEQVRDLLHVEDATSAFVTAAEQIRQLSPGAVFNVCSGTGVRIREVGTLVAELLPCPTELLRWGEKPMRSSEPLRIVGSPQKFMKLTGWKPCLTLREGLVQTILQLRHRFSNAYASSA